MRQATQVAPQPARTAPGSHDRGKHCPTNRLQLTTLVGGVLGSATVTIAQRSGRGVQPPRDNEAFRFPVSVKGVVIRGGEVVLIENERDEWELPGGKLEPAESPQVCVAREIAEELRLQVEASTLLDTWVYSITPEVRVLIVTYGCSETVRVEAVLSHEHKQLRWFPLSQVSTLRMPEGYKASIRRWAMALGESDV